MNSRVIYVAIALAAVGFVHMSGSSAALPPPPCTGVDTSNPHFFNAFSNAGVGTETGQIGGGIVVVYSANGVPTGCDQFSSDGDNEQGISGAEMPIIGATCPYSQGPFPATVGHHGDDIYATNVANIDITWSSGIDGQDPVALLAGQTCTGNGVIGDNATTDPADCLDSTGANINLLGGFYDDTHPLGVGTNQFRETGSSSYTCLDSVDGNEWTFLNTGPFLLIVPTDGPILNINGGATAQDQEGLVYVWASTNAGVCVNEVTVPEDEVTDTNPCLVGVDGGANFLNDWAPASVLVGLSLPIQGTIASGVEPVGDSD
jgi:hypothetical protein